MAGPWTGPARLQRNGGGQPGVHHVPATSGKTKDRSARFSTKNSRTASTSSFLSHAVPAFATMSLISEMVGSLSSSRTACCLPSGTLSDMTGAILERTRRLQAREINILRRGKYSIRTQAAQDRPLEGRVREQPYRLHVLQARGGSARREAGGIGREHGAPQPYEPYERGQKQNKHNKAAVPQYRIQIS